MFFELVDDTSESVRGASRFGRMSTVGKGERECVGIGWSQKISDIVYGRILLHVTYACKRRRHILSR